MRERWARRGRQLAAVVTTIVLTSCVTSLAAGFAAAAPEATAPPRIVSPASGEVVGPDHTFTGTAAAGATVTISVRPLAPPGGGPTPMSIEPQEGRDPEQVTAEGRWEISLDHPLPAGTYLVTATQQLGAATSPASESVSFEVAGTDAPPASESTLSVGAAALIGLLAIVAVGVATLFVVRRRRST